MDKTELTAELCGIIETMAGIIRRQRDQLAQLGALELEEESAQALEHYHSLIGESEA